MVCGKGVRRTPTRVLQKDRVCARTHLTSRATCPNTPPTPLQKLWALIPGGAAKGHKRERQLGHKAAGGAGAPSAVRGIPTTHCVLLELTGSGPDFLGETQGALLPCPKQAPGQGSQRPPSLALCPANTPGASSTFSGAVPSGLLLVTGSLVTSLSSACEAATASPRPDLRCFPPATLGSPSLPPGPPGVRCVPRDLSNASVTNTTARPHPTLTRFLGQCLSLLGGRRPRPDPGPAA